MDLKAVSRYLDRMLGRSFTKDAEAVARIFVRQPQGDPRVLWVDDLAVVPASIKIDENGDGGFAGETALAADDFELWPLNADKGPEARPWTMIHLPPSGGRAGWPAGRRVEVTAQWGWPAVPEAIARATAHLTAVLRLETPQGHQTRARAWRRVRSEPRGRRASCGSWPARTGGCGSDGRETADESGQGAGPDFEKAQRGPGRAAAGRSPAHGGHRRAASRQGKSAPRHRSAGAQHHFGSRVANGQGRIDPGIRAHCRRGRTSRQRGPVLHAGRGETR